MKTKYTLIQRENCLPVAVDSVGLELIKQYSKFFDRLLNETSITLNKIKKQTIPFYETAYIREVISYELAHEKYEGKPFKARVRWFDRSTGRGSVESLEDGQVFELLACNIKGKKTWFPETACVYLEENQVIDILVHVNSSSIFDAECLTAGKFDEEKWSKLDHNSLAFRCDENGKAVSGLFK